MSVSVAMSFKARYIFDCCNFVNMGSNPSWDMDECPHFSVLALFCVGTNFAMG
jgi:hypothetical protein